MHVDRMAKYRSYIYRVALQFRRLIKPSIFNTLTHTVVRYEVSKKKLNLRAF